MLYFLQIAPEVTDSAGAAVTAYTPGEEYTVTVPSYVDPANMWIHSSAGTIVPVDVDTHAPATECPQAAYSLMPAATHAFTWTAPATATPVTVSIAQSASPTDFYHTVVVLSLLFCFYSVTCVNCSFSLVYMS